MGTGCIATKRRGGMRSQGYQFGCHFLHGGTVVSGLTLTQTCQSVSGAAPRCGERVRRQEGTLSADPPDVESHVSSSLVRFRRPLSALPASSRARVTPGFSEAQ
jgi:hypothetical protein